MKMTTTTTTTTRNNIDSISNKSKLNIVFYHPNLGIGGAERLIVDAAVGLQQQGHIIKLYTSYHNPQHAFNETYDNGSLSSCIYVYGQSIPSSIYGKFHIIMAHIKAIYTAIYILYNEYNTADVFILDQISSFIPLLKYLHYNSRILFYCHYPDLLLSQNRQSLLKKLYRLPYDYIEQITTLAADCICVNSKFTLSVVEQTFNNLYKKHKTIHIVYPATDTNKFDLLQQQYDEITKNNNSNNSSNNNDEPLLQLSSDTILFTSINRYERKKNIQLCISSLVELRNKYNNNTTQYNKIKLIIAGGYDTLNNENVEYLPELQQYATQHNITYSNYPVMTGQIIFMINVTDLQKYILFNRSLCILYTPANEHFGIVPIESMYNNCCIIACNSGGPTESIVHNETGYLCKNTATDFANAMYQCINNIQHTKQLGLNGHKRVVDYFSFDTFKHQLNNIVIDLAEHRHESRGTSINILHIIVGIVILFFAIVIFNIFR